MNSRCRGNYITKADKLENWCTIVGVIRFRPAQPPKSDEPMPPCERRQRGEIGTLRKDIGQLNHYNRGLGTIKLKRRVGGLTGCIFCLNIRLLFYQIYNRRQVLNKWSRQTLTFVKRCVVVHKNLSSCWPLKGGRSRKKNADNTTQWIWKIRHWKATDNIELVHVK